MKKPYQIESQRAVKQLEAVAAGTNNRRQGSAVGQLRNVPSRRAADGDGVGEVNARPEHEEIRPGGARVHRSLRTGEERDQRAFHRASREKLKAMMERRLEKTRLSTLLIDATPFAGQQMVAALGIGEDGRKTILGIRQGATENATVVGELLADLADRGLDFTEPRLYVLDGGKALSAAVKKYASESAVIQRCQVHKRRNVLDHLTDEQKSGVAKQLNAAYALEDYAAAKQALNALHRELMDLNPSAARSLGEGMEETLTVHRLHLPMQLRKTMASTNVIESAFSIVEQVCKNVKRWHGGDQRERWVGSGLLVAEKQFRRVTGYKQIPALMRELAALIPSKSEVVKRRKAS